MTGSLTRRRMIGMSGIASLVPFISSRPAQALAPPGGVSGELITLITPVRLFDSRTASPSIGGGKISADNDVAVTVSGGTLDGSTAVVAYVNVTVTDTEQSGYLVVSASDLSGERPIPATSNVNWSATGQTLANLAVTAVGGESAISIRCGGIGRTHFIVDLQAYVPFAG